MCEQVRLGVGNGSIPESNEKQSHELGRNLPEGFEDSLIDICWHFPGFLEANKITTEIPKTGQPGLGVPVESGAVVSTLCSGGLGGILLSLLRRRQGEWLGEMCSEPSSLTAALTSPVLYIGSSQMAQWQRICLQCKRHRYDPWGGKPPGGGNGNPFLYSCLGNPIDRATVCGVAKSWTRLSTHACGTYCIRLTYWISV